MSTEEQTTGSPPTKRRKLNEEQTSEENTTEKIDTIRTRGLADEEQIGIKSFVGARDDYFKGIIKLRFEDFLVNEVGLDGNVVRLTTYESINPPTSQASSQSSNNPREAIDQIIDAEESENFWKFISETPEEERKKATFTFKEIATKDQRTAMHKAIKLIDGVRASTVNGCIVVEFFEKKAKGREKDDWSNDVPQFVHFALEKKNVDTTKCIADLSVKLQVRSSRFGVAGTKDKRGITVQLVSAWKIEPRKILNSTSRLYGIKVGNFRFANEGLKLGDLFGNRFSIVIREVEGDNEKINKSLENTKENGFINYYGTQRFGTGKIPSHHVGLAVLKNNWEKVIELLLCPDNRDDTKAGLEHYKNTSNIAESLKFLKPRTIEFKILQALQKNGEKSLYNAFSALPRNLRLLYVHAYQSFVWNSAASERITRFGRNIAEGDLVLIEETTVTEAPPQNEEQQLPQVDDVCEGTVKQKVQYITQKDIDEGKFTIYDVVLPLPGTDVLYPTNSVKEVYSSMLASEGLDINNLTHKFKDYTLHGSYRRLLQKPIDLEWEIVKYDNAEIPLFQWDSMKLENKELPTAEIEGKYTGVKVSVTLHRSVYATIFLREAMKYPTHYQKDV